MQYKNEELGVSFEIPDRVTVRMQLTWDGAALGAFGAEVFTRLWEAAKGIIQNWECPYLPLNANIDELDCADANFSKINRVIRWAGLTAHKHMREVNDIPKNS